MGLSKDPVNDSYSKIRVLCVDDHDLLRKGIAAMLGSQKDMELVGEASNGREAIDVFRKLRPDITLLDMHLPDIGGIGVTKMIIAEDPAARIIVLSSYCGEHEIFSAIEAGVRGYILKEMVHTEVVRAIRTVHKGKRLIPPLVNERLNEHFATNELTDAETKVLRLVARGLGNKDIGEQLGVASGTVKMHLHSVYSKLGASDRAHAVALAVRRGIIHLDP
jgi:DNA-binding NarL/FixJ family response regulator